MWNPFTFREEPYDYQAALRYARQLLEQ